MWKESFDVLRQLITLYQDTLHNKDQIKTTQQEVTDLRQEVRDLRQEIKALDQGIKDVRQDVKDIKQEMQAMTRAITHLMYEVRRVEDEDVSERTILALRLEAEMTRFECRLPSGKPNEE